MNTLCDKNIIILQSSQYSISQSIKLLKIDVAIKDYNFWKNVWLVFQFIIGPIERPHVFSDFLYSQIESFILMILKVTYRPKLLNHNCYYRYGTDTSNLSISLQSYCMSMLSPQWEYRKKILVNTIYTLCKIKEINYEYIYILTNIPYKWILNFVLYPYFMLFSSFLEIEIHW